jgi:hypothetical protein
LVVSIDRLESGWVPLAVGHRRCWHHNSIISITADVGVLTNVDVTAGVGVITGVDVITDVGITADGIGIDNCFSDCTGVDVTAGVGATAGVGIITGVGIVSGFASNTHSSLLCIVRLSSMASCHMFTHCCLFSKGRSGAYIVQIIKKLSCLKSPSRSVKLIDPASLGSNE